MAVLVFSTGGRATVMGTKSRDFAPLPNLSLEELVPKDNFCRRLDATLDLSFVRELVRECYASSGRPSVDPVVFFRLQLEMCFEAGLVWGEELFFDSAKVEANADTDSLRSRSIAQNHLKELFEDTGSQEIEDFVTSPPPSPCASVADALPTAGEESLKENNARSEDWISRDGRQDRSFSSGSRKRTADRLVSITDPDATPMRLGSEGQTKLGYQAHYVVDGGKVRVILNVLVTPSEVSENRPMLDLLWRSAFRWHLWPRQVTGDAKYGTAEN